ncbi:MAG: PEP-CTERM sorting domain-containing protein, partial [Patescibacteria group bacterium]|nr:PEP-CTERM sorting domain-containing protein [Patescibacteria group bacterium]
ETYLLVAKIDANPSVDDVFSLKIYDQSMTPDLIEPTSFDLVAMNGSGVNLGYMLIGMNTGGAIDEIRIGTTWAVVIGVPEPSSAAMLLSVVLGACVTFRPRRRIVR